MRKPQPRFVDECRRLESLAREFACQRGRKVLNKQYRQHRRTGPPADALVIRGQRQGFSQTRDFGRQLAFD
jgi:hypothetical protein